MTASKNVLSSDVEIKGSIKFSQDFIIDGKVEGEIISDGNLTIGANALVKSDIKTRSVTILGKVDGNISVAEKCELKATAHLVGDISASALAIEEGATFIGRSEVSSKKGSAGSTVPSAGVGSQENPSPAQKILSGAR